MGNLVHVIRDLCGHYSYEVLGALDLRSMVLGALDARSMCSLFLWCAGHWIGDLCAPSLYGVLGALALRSS